MTVDVDLSQEGEVAEGVSPRHARVIQESGLHLVEDPGSTYGTKLNGANLEAGELFPLHPGDHLCLDSCILYYAWRSRWSRREMGLSNSLYRC
jgi:hypothetical protein